MGTSNCLPLSLLVVVLAIRNDHQQHGSINFHSPNEHNVFDLNLLASDDLQCGDINFDGPHDYNIFEHNLQASDGLQDGDIIFDGPHDYGVFDLNLPASEQQQEMHQMISKPQISIPFYLNYSMRTLTKLVSEHFPKCIWN